MNAQKSRNLLPAFGDPMLFAECWPDVPYHSPQSAVSLRSTLTWSAIDTILNDTALQVPAFRVARDNKLVPLESVTRPDRSTSLGITGLADAVGVVTELGRGATLVLQGLHRFWPPLGTVARRLAAEIGHAVFVNAYLTPRSAQGFGAHTDPYHAWLVQVEGDKTWQLWAPGRDPDTDRPDHEVVLAAGDTLWIPRGWWHAGRTGELPSLHLTFTVWASQLEDVLAAMVAELARRPEFTRELPPNAFLDNERASQTLADSAAQITKLSTEISLRALRDRVLEAHLDRFDPLPAPSVGVILDVCRDVPYHTHPESILHSSADESGVQIMTADATLTVDTDQFLACAELLQRTDTFRLDDIGELPGSCGDSWLSQLIEARLVCSAACLGSG